MSTANPNLREPSSDLSDSLGETVWKIAEGVSSTLLWRQEAADRDFFDPSWPLRSPDSGSIPNFQTVSEDEFSEVQLRACANRRVAYVARSSKKAIESLLPLSSTKSCQPIGAAS